MDSVVVCFVLCDAKWATSCRLIFGIEFLKLILSHRNISNVHNHRRGKVACSYNWRCSDVKKCGP